MATKSEGFDWSIIEPFPFPFPRSCVKRGDFANEAVLEPFHVEVNSFGLL
jgi:hypothetical protein